MPKPTGENIPVLEVRNLGVRLRKGSDRSHAVENISFSVMPREIVCIVGESGSGKSVTASAVMGLLPKGALTLDTGHILLAGQDITHASPEELRALRGNQMAMVFQEPMTALNPLMMVGDQIGEVYEFHKRSLGRREISHRVLSLLEDVNLPSPEKLRYAYPHQLSGGQRQRVMIAMALAMEPKLIIADEPTTALDVTTQSQILHLLNRLRKQHDNGVLFITHDFDVVAEIADRVLVMQNGHIVESGPTDKILSNPQHNYTQKLLAGVPKGTFDARNWAKGKATTLLAIKDVSVQFGTASIFRPKARVVNALTGVSLEVARGETVGVVGESGSGKTTLGRCVTRLERASSGAILLEGEDLSRMPAKQWRATCKRVQMVFQDPFRSFNPRLKIGYALTEGPMNFGMSSVEARAQMQKMLALVGIDPRAADRYPHEFSGGQRQRISIARALMMEPEIIIADEAVSALDVSVQAQILDLFESIREQLKLSMLFITHDLRVAARLCHRIAVMRRGEIVEIGNTRQIFSQPVHTYTRELLAAIPGRQLG